MSCKNIPRMGLNCRLRCQILLLWSLELWSWIYLAPGGTLCQFRKGCRGDKSLRHLFLDHGLSQLLRISPGTWAENFWQRNSALGCNFSVCSCMHREQLDVTGLHWWNTNSSWSLLATPETSKTSSKNHEIIQKKRVEFLIYLSAGLQRFDIFLLCGTKVTWRLLLLWDHKIMEWLWWEGILKFIPFQAPALSRGTFH